MLMCWYSEDAAQTAAISNTYVMQLLDKHWVGKEGTHTNISRSVQSMEKSNNPQMLLHPKVTRVVYKSDDEENT